ncbi:hypothetical protein SRABI134_04406 [Peribacillus sp. Bi134]|nr:hypothetical protein SRABI134_04406 [Peribacillus sp. Bi134]
MGGNLAENRKIFFIMHNFLQPDSLRQAIKKEGSLYTRALFTLHHDQESDSVSKKPEFTWFPSTLPYKLFQCRTCLTYIAIPAF